ncbi:MAG: hypothetical protein ACLVJO_11715 [[Clostridium] scindens]
MTNSSLENYETMMHLMIRLLHDG